MPISVWSFKMKAYQAEWACMLNANSLYGELINDLCDEIVSDDTGHTDGLAMALASKLSEINQELIDTNEGIARENAGM